MRPEITGPRNERRKSIKWVLLFRAAPRKKKKEQHNGSSLFPFKTTETMGTVKKRHPIEVGAFRLGRETVYIRTAPGKAENRKRAQPETKG